MSAAPIHIMLPSGRTKTVHLSYGSHLNGIIRELENKNVLSKNGTLEYVLSYNRKPLDLSLTLRQASLPHGVTLYLSTAPTPSTRTGSVLPIKIALQLPDSTRLIRSFTPSSTLYDVLLASHSSDEGRNLLWRCSETQTHLEPRCMVLGKELVGVGTLVKTSLRDLGLGAGGNGVIRLDWVDGGRSLEEARMEVEREKTLLEPEASRATDSTRRQTGLGTEGQGTELLRQGAVMASSESDSVAALAETSSVPQVAAPLCEDLSRSDCCDESQMKPVEVRGTVGRDGGREVESSPGSSSDRARSPGRPVASEEDAGRVVPSTMDVEPAWSGSLPQACSSAPQPSQAPSPENGDTQPFDRKIRYYLPGQRTSPHDSNSETHGDDTSSSSTSSSFFQLTPAELARLYAGTQSRRQALENAPLTTSRMRQAQEQLRREKMPLTIIRLRFRDTTVLEVVFQSHETLRDVYRVLAHVLGQPCGGFKLFEMVPPRTVLEPGSGRNLWEAGLAPGAVVGLDSGSYERVLAFVKDTYALETVASPPPARPGLSPPALATPPHPGTRSPSHVSTEDQTLDEAEHSPGSPNVRRVPDGGTFKSSASALVPGSRGKVPKWFKFR